MCLGSSQNDSMIEYISDETDAINDVDDMSNEYVLNFI